ncbi:MAG: hypothetical protein QOJ56_1473 [Mycobacterium sp.]|jgi:hypothetical protein|nr:hypothetical protein [Mycobacterium sp.]MDT5352941.1 hypothetical protein [Mycobacterium sp.]
MDVGTPLPTLSQIHNWDTEHLSQAALDWEAEAQRWETTYEHNYQRLAETDWKGQAREAALERAGLDLVKVRGPAWQLREAATAARYGFTQQNGAKEWALDAVADAEQAGFNPKEDLSLTDRLTGGSAATRVARQAEAQALAAQIRHRAALLVASNQEIATRITAAAGNIGEFSFDEPTSVATTRSGQKTNGIQLVDNKTWKQDPPPPPPPRPHPGLPPEGVRPPIPGKLTPGPASKSRARRFGGESLWDENGGEWRYFPGDKYRNPHWDYNPNDRNNPDWENIPIGGLPPHKAVPDPPAPPVPNRPPQFPPMDMPDPPAAPAPIYTSPPGGPIISLPQISHDDAAKAGATTGATGIAGILAWLALIVEQN